MSRDQATALQPGQQSETSSETNKKPKTKQKENPEYYAKVDFLVLTMYYDYGRHFHCGKLCEGYMGPLCAISAISCEF